VRKATAYPSNEIVIRADGVTGVSEGPLATFVRASIVSKLPGKPLTVLPILAVAEAPPPPSPPPPGEPIPPPPHAEANASWKTASAMLKERMMSAYS